MSNEDIVFKYDENITERQKKILLAGLQESELTEEINNSTMKDAVTSFVNDSVHFINALQNYHWQTKSYAEHEAFGEYYSKINSLNDQLVETWNGREDERLTFSAEYKPNVLNYADKNECIRVVKDYRKKIFHLESCIDKSHFDLHSILEDFLKETNQLLYHLSLN